MNGKQECMENLSLVYYTEITYIRIVDTMTCVCLYYSSQDHYYTAPDADFYTGIYLYTRYNNTVTYVYYSTMTEMNLQNI